jgi:hypothetical protein
MSIHPGVPIEIFSHEDMVPGQNGSAMRIIKLFCKRIEPFSTIVDDGNRKKWLGTKKMA